MATYYIANSGTSPFTSTFTNAGNVSRSFTKNRSSGQNQNENIGNKVINNNDADKVKIENDFAKNNQRPILNKTEYGNLVVTNNSKQIRSTLTATAVRNGEYSIYSGKFDSVPLNTIDYLCPPNDASAVYYLGNTFETSQTNLTESNFCYQFVPPTTNSPEIPIVLNNDEINQNGIYLRYREKNDLYNDWSTIFVPQSSIVPATGVADDGTSYVFDSINFSDVLPNGDYIVEYDLLESE